MLFTDQNLFLISTYYCLIYILPKSFLFSNFTFVWKLKPSIDFVILMASVRALSTVRTDDRLHLTTPARCGEEGN